MDTPQLPEDFREFLRLLNAREVKYLLVGGYAVGHHGYPRATVDIDIWVAMDAQNADALVHVLREFGFGSGPLKPALFLKEDQIVRMGLPPFRIEVMTTIDGVDFAACYARRNAAVIDGLEVSVISRDDLIANKKASGRHKDLNDLENLP